MEWILRWRNAVSAYANIIRDWDDWYKNIDMRTVLQNLSENAVEELHLSTRIADMSVEELADRDLFRDVDEMIVNKLFERLGSQSITDDQVQRIINGQQAKTPGMQNMPTNMSALPQQAGSVPFWLNAVNSSAPSARRSRG